MGLRLLPILLALAAPGRVPGQAPPPEVPLGLETFEEGLAPFGRWVDVAPYGHAWRPADVGADWRPYLDGWWIWTDDGWFWASDEPWAWATYHYGRWVYDLDEGWVWVPGYEWAPAWVAWRFGAAAVGWAPLYPGFDAWWAGDYPLQPGAWIFVPAESFVGVPVPTVCYPPHRSPALLQRTRPAPPRGAPGRDGRTLPAPPRGGPPPAWVERRIGRPVATVRTAPVPAPDLVRGGPRGGPVPVYRPPALAVPRSPPVAVPAHPRPPAPPPVPAPPREASPPPPKR